MGQAEAFGKENEKAMKDAQTAQAMQSGTYKKMFKNVGRLLQDGIQEISADTASTMGHNNPMLTRGVEEMMVATYGHDALKEYPKTMKKHRKNLKAAMLAASRQDKEFDLEEWLKESTGMSKRQQERAYKGFSRGIDDFVKSKTASYTKKISEASKGFESLALKAAPDNSWSKGKNVTDEQKKGWSAGAMLHNQLKREGDYLKNSKQTMKHLKLQIKELQTQEAALRKGGDVAGADKIKANINQTKYIGEELELRLQAHKKTLAAKILPQVIQAEKDFYECKTRQTAGFAALSAAKQDKSIELARKNAEAKVRANFDSGQYLKGLSEGSQTHMKKALKQHENIDLEQVQKASKLAKLEAVASTVKRLEKLKDMPKRLKTLEKTIGGWDATKTAAVAKRLMCKIKMIIDAINDGVVTSGLNKVGVTINEQVAKDIGTVGKLIQGVNTAMNVRGISAKKAKEIVESTKIGIKKLAELGSDEYLPKFVDGGSNFAAAVPIIKDVKTFVGDKKSGYISLIRELVSWKNTFRKSNAVIGDVVFSLGLSDASGVRGIMASANEISKLSQGLGSIDLKASKGMFGDMAVLAKGVVSFSNQVSKTSEKKFGKAGTVAKVIAGFLESYNSVKKNLSAIAKDPLPMDLSMKLENFADALGVTNDSFTINNEALNFTINVKVEMSAEDIACALADPTIVQSTEGPLQRTGKSSIPVKTKQ